MIYWKKWLQRLVPEGEKGWIMSTEELKQAAEFINDVGMVASIIEKGENLPANILLAGLPEEAEEGHLVVCSPMDMEEEGGFSDYIQLYYEIPIDIEGIELSELFYALNRFNSLVPIGHFIYGTEEGKRKRVYLRHTLVYDIDEKLSPSVLCECIQSILEYSRIMEEILAGLSSGMDVEQILKAEFLDLSGN